MGYEDQILDAIEAIVDNAVQKARYDKTILCTIIECVDATVGKYKVKYQDSSFMAYSGSSETVYVAGTQVYVLVPGNDMTRDKTILGSTKKLGINFAGGVTEDENYYEKVGNNCIEKSGEYEFCSYSDNETNTIIVYDTDTEGNPTINEIGLNTKSVDTYIKQSGSIICGGQFKTKLPIEQQFRGNFGIIYELTFLDNASEEKITRNYVVGVDQMFGNPYRQKTWTRQYEIFDIDTPNFLYVSKVTIFAIDFPNKAPNKPMDIFIKDLELCGATLSSEDDILSYGLVFITPQGTYFDNNDAPSATRTIRAQVRVKGKNVDNNSQDLQYYWFVENVAVTTNHPHYLKEGGRGWECKNLRNQVGTDENGQPVYEWTPASWEYIVKKSDSDARETKYKCVAIYEGVQISKEIVITNFSSQWEIGIESDSGTKFYYDLGSPTLTCVVKNAGTEVSGIEGLEYMWAKVDSYNEFTTLDPTPAMNEEYNNAKKRLDEINDAVENEDELPATLEDERQAMLTILRKYDKIMRVEDKHLWKVQVKDIIKFTTFKCSVYRNGVFLGSNSIIITNSLEAEDVYSLIINNGTQIFKYDEEGVSPVNTLLDNKIRLLPLTFTLYDNMGREIPEEVIDKCHVKWIIPARDTMIELPQLPKDLNPGFSYGEQEQEDPMSQYWSKIPAADDGRDITAYYVFSGNGEICKTLPYAIANRYAIDKLDNNIRLELTYKEMNLSAKTNLTFLKEGDSGTNGTEYTCQIVPNSDSLAENVYPMLLNKKPNWKVTGGADEWFKVQFWHNGEKIYDGNQLKGTTLENKDIVMTWSILANNYRGEDKDHKVRKVSDPSNITIGTKIVQTGGNNPGEPSKTDTVWTFGWNDEYNPASYDYYEARANIIKCNITYEGNHYYVTYPLIVGDCYDGYSIGLKEVSGYRSVLYSADGRRPKYDNSKPFQLVVTKEVNGTVEDISLITKNDNYKLNYQWAPYSMIFDNVLGKWISGTTFDDKGHWTSTMFTWDNDYEEENSFNNPVEFKPVDGYNGECVTAGLRCHVELNDSPVGNIFIPIHFLLNKYGHAALNDWDGNSIQIQNDQGFILAPQVGAGIKNDSNQFTGMLMGEVKEVNQSHPDVGLLGYHNGDRTMYLSAYDGYAIFGKFGPGQLILDPSSGHAMIYSNNFWKKYYEETFFDENEDEETRKENAAAINEDGTLNGLPVTDYQWDDKTQKYTGQANENPDDMQFENSGMLIDLTEPRIFFGSGNFRVDPNGYLYAKGGGQIAGWKIDDYEIHSVDGDRRSQNIGHTGMNSVNGVKSDGTEDFTKKGAILKNVETPSGLKLKSYAFWAGLGSNSSTNYRNSDDDKFFVTHDGYVRAQEMTIGSGSTDHLIYIGKSTYKDGDKTIEHSAIYTYNHPTRDGGGSGFYLGTDGIALGNTFSVNESGYLKSTSGSIGGWDITSSQLKKDNLVLNSRGNLYGGEGTDPNNDKQTTGWAIYEDGSARFGCLHITSDGNIISSWGDWAQLIGEFHGLLLDNVALWQDGHARSIASQNNVDAAERRAKGYADDVGTACNGYTNGKFDGAATNHLWNFLTLGDEGKSPSHRKVTIKNGLIQEVDDVERFFKAKGTYCTVHIPLWQGQQPVFNTYKELVLTFNHGLIQEATIHDRSGSSVTIVSPTWSG